MGGEKENNVKVVQDGAKVLVFPSMDSKPIAVYKDEGKILFLDKLMTIDQTVEFCRALIRAIQESLPENQWAEGEIQVHTLWRSKDDNRPEPG